MVNFEPMFPSTHSIVASLCATARLVTLPPTDEHPDLEQLATLHKFKKVLSLINDTTVMSTFVATLQTTTIEDVLATGKLPPPHGNVHPALDEAISAALNEANAGLSKLVSQRKPAAAKSARRSKSGKLLYELEITGVSSQTVAVSASGIFGVLAVQGKTDVLNALLAKVGLKIAEQVANDLKKPEITRQDVAK